MAIDDTIESIALRHTGFDQFIAAETAAWLPRHFREQTKLGQRQGQFPLLPLSIAHPGKMHLRIDAQDADLQICSFMSHWMSRTPQDRMDTGDHLGWFERLGDVVVGTEPKSEQGIDLIGERCEHDHWPLAFGTQCLQDIETILTGQADIEQDERRVDASCQLQANAPITGMKRLKTILLQIQLQDLGDLKLIFDDENAGRRHVPS